MYYFKSNEDGILPSIKPITSGIFQRRTNLPATVGPAIMPIIITSSCNKSSKVAKSEIINPAYQ